MPVPKIPKYKPWDIEPIAQEFLSAYWNSYAAPVDIETIIEGALEMLIDYTSIDSFRTIGAICRRKSDGKLVIVVSEKLADTDPNRYRFTLAQEVAHFLLHKSLLESITTQEEALEFHRLLSCEQYKQMESDVNRCAGAILMPQHQFREAACDAYEEWFSKVKTRGNKIIPSFVQKRVVDDLAKLYQVSFKAAEIRLKHWPIKLYDDILESARRAQPQLSTGW